MAPCFSRRKNVDIVAVSHSLERLKKVTQELGVELLSDRYEGYDFEVEIRCSCGQVFERSPRLIYRAYPGKIFCKECRYSKQARNQTKPIPPEKALKVVSQLNAEIVGSPDVVTVNSYLDLRCLIHGETFRSRFWNLNHGHRGCTACSGKRMRSIEEVRKIVSDRGGFLLTKRVRSSTEYFKIRCSEGHVFKNSLNKIDAGRWCNFCAKKRFVGEEITRQFMEFIFSAPFEKVKPKWLVFKGKRLELDGFNEKLGVAFEHDGDQHFRFIKKYHQTQKDFFELQQSDRAKDEICRSRGVVLLRFKEHRNGSLLKDQFNQQMNLIARFDLRDPKDFKVDLVSAYAGSFRRLSTRMNEVLRGTGLKMIDLHLSGHHSVMLECSVGHRFSRYYYSLSAKRIFSCPECKAK